MGMELLSAAIVSVVTQFVKKQAGTSHWGSVALMVVFSFLAAGVYYWFSHTAFWPSLVAIGALANTIYAVFISAAEKNK